MKVAILLVAMVAVGVASAQDYYYGADPAPSMYAASVGSVPQPPPPPPSMEALMAGAVPQFGAASYLGQQMPLPMTPALLEQQQAQAAVAAQQNAAPYFQTEEAELEEGAEEGEAEEEADESEATEEEAESVEGEEEGAEEEAEAEGGETEDVGAEERFSTRRRKGLFRRVGAAIGRGARRVGKAVQRVARKFAHIMGKGKPGMKGKPVFKPIMGKPKNNARSPSAKTPKAAGGKKLPPMPAPLPAQPKIDCKKNPGLCIDAETPAEGETPGDHSPRAVFKKKMEVIKKSLMINNRNIAAESKWIDQVELIMKQYAIKVKKVKEHIADERKAIKELLRQRRIILNEKKQKELEAKLKMATTELSALTDALTQVQKKERELGTGKGQLTQKIKLLAGDLKQLRTTKSLDEAQALKKRD